MTQECFDKMYSRGINSDKLSLTDSKTITNDDLIDSAIYRMYFNNNMSLTEIKKQIQNKLKEFQIAFKNDL